MNDRRVPWLMHQILPHAATVKFVVILRDPIERTISGYWQASRDPLNNMSQSRADELALQEVAILRRVYNASLALTPEARGGQILNPAGCFPGRMQYQRLNKKLRALNIQHPWFARYIKKAAISPDQVMTSGGKESIYEV
jgi:hypothetical protein